MKATVQVNGEVRELPLGATIPELLSELGLPDASVLVEHNGTALFKADWGSVILCDGDQVEIIRIVAGG